MPLFVFWDDGFSVEELKKINDTHASWDEKKYLHFLPDSKNEEMPRSDNRWIFSYLNNLIERINDSYFFFDLYGYDTYDYVEMTTAIRPEWNSALKYNEDSGTSETIKLCAELQINSNEEFEGGNLLIDTSDEAEPFVVDNQQGRLIVYPSWLKVSRTPIVSGTRKILKFDVLGPRFK
jgi:hypothetical protein